MIVLNAKKNQWCKTEPVKQMHMFQNVDMWLYYLIQPTITNPFEQTGAD